ncbi:hypothetical protein CLCAR_1759 [Clostridium carboxidivorans P7]|nr:hypothetical protein CLCAR_1759 [Clostridium carboxidivorans P7]
MNSKVNKFIDNSNNIVEIQTKSQQIVADSKKLISGEK